MKVFKNFKLPSKLLAKESFNRDQKLISLESPKAFIDLLMKHGFKIIKLCIHKKSKVVAKLRMFHNFGRYLMFLNKHHGSLYVVKYLKAAQLSIQRKLAGQPFSSLREIEPDLLLPRLAKCGLPAIIGTRDRQAILAGSTSVIRLYLSLFGLYRVLQAPVKAKLNTITDPYTGNEEFLKNMLGQFEKLSKNLINNFKWSPLSFLLMLETSSPNSKKSVLGITKDAVTWKKLGMDHLLERWLELTNNKDLKFLFSLLKEKSKANWEFDKKEALIGWYYKNKKVDLSTLLSLMNHHSIKTEDIFGNSKVMFFDWQTGYNGPVLDQELFNLLFSMKVLKPCFSPILKDGFKLGQLAFKEEAAGKLRIFAMVDVWTQSILKPLHDALFKVLRQLPNDGTFDQNSSFERAVIKAHTSGCCFGYDLSSATDRLPLSLQVSILKPLIGDELATLWGKILVDREYDIPKNSYGISGSVKYSVGQPMGALSSWAMLALTHHMIMQYCSKLIGNSGWCTQYEVLGDDIVIFNEALASKYLEIMELIGVPINEMKSVISKTGSTVEFAKRTSYHQTDVSPISWKMFFNQDTFAGRLSIVNYWWTRNRDYLISSMNTICQRNLSDNRPKFDNNTFLSLLTTLVSKGKLDLDWVLAKISDKKDIIFPFGKAIVINFPIDWAKNLLTRYWKNEEIVSLRPFMSFNYSLDQRYHKAALIKEIKSLLNKYTDKYMDEKIQSISQYSFSVISRKYLNRMLFSQRLTIRSLRFVNLQHFEFDRLMLMLQQIQSSTSAFGILNVAKKKEIISNDLAILKLIEKSMRKSNRKDPNICPLTITSYSYPGSKWHGVITGYQQRH